MVGWHHRLDGHEFEQTPGNGEGQGGLACCSPWGLKELDMTKQLNIYSSVVTGFLPDKSRRSVRAEDTMILTLKMWEWGLEPRNLGSL